MTEAEATHPTAISATATDPPSVPALRPPDFGEHELPPLAKPAELGGPKGPEPTRYGDWERKGRCIDF